jgi:hypothetical protein
MARPAKPLRLGLRHTLSNLAKISGNSLGILCWQVAGGKIIVLFAETADEFSTTCVTQDHGCQYQASGMS